MNKNKLKIVLILITLLVITIGLGVYGYNGIYTNITDYDSMTDRVSSDYSILTNRSFNNDILTLEIDTDEFNGFINRKKTLNDIELNNSDLDLNDICIDSSNEEIYLNVNLENGKSMDIVGNYFIKYSDDEILLDVNLSTIGSNPIIISAIMLDNLDINMITIPLDTETNNIYESLIQQLLLQSDKEISISNNRSSIEVDIDIDSYDLTNTNNLEPLSTSSFSTISHTNEGEKYLTFKQAQLVKDRINSDSLQELLDLGINNNLFVNYLGEVYLRFTDNDSDFNFDTKLQLGVDSSSNNTLVAFEAIEAYSSDVSIADEMVVQELQDIFSPKAISSLHDYTVIDARVTPNEIEFNVEQTSWTIMIYLNGSDLESGYDEYTGEIYAKATEDITEMMSGLESSNINLILETGGTLDWKMAGIRSDINQRFKVEDGKLIHLEDLEMKNMTAPETLIDFANYGIEEYPSEKYALLMWNHGGGSLYGFGVDEHFYGDSLTLDELEFALDSITTTNDMVFEVIGFDACLMATLETADVCAPYGNYLIASEETEPDYGWDYDRIFKTLADGDAYDGDSFGELVVSGFIDYSVEANQEEMLTLSVIDLSRVNKVVLSMNELITKIAENSDESDEGLNSVSRIIPQIKAFGGNTEYTGYTDHYDLENFAKKLTEYYPREANKLIAAIDSAVIYKASGYLATDAGGLSFYLPFYDLYYEDQIDEMYSSVSFSDEYTAFMSEFVDYRINSTYDSGDLQFSVNTDVDPYVLTIGSSSLEYVSNVYMNVLAYYEDDTTSYYRDLGFDAWVMETDTPGQYEDSFSFWPSLMGDYLPIQVVYHGDDYIEYETPIYLNGEQATMISGWLYDEERYAIFGARPYLDETEDTNGIVDRNTIEFVDGDEIEILYDTYSMQTGEWSFEPHLSFSVDLEKFEIVDNQFETGSYGLQFVIEDYNGEFTFTDLYEFDY